MGIGDVSVGLKHVLGHSLERGHIASVGAEVVLPTGDHSDGLGKGTPIFESGQPSRLRISDAEGNTSEDTETATISDSTPTAAFAADLHPYRPAAAPGKPQRIENCEIRP